MKYLNSGIDWTEILYIVIGSFLGFALSILTTIVNRAIDRHGKIRLFSKFVYQKTTHLKARIYGSDGQKKLCVPLYFELQNTSNTARVIRDTCLYLYKDGKRIARMQQIQYSKNSETNEITYSYGGDKNSYSFVLLPLSIQKQECEFFYQVPASEVDKFSFDEIRVAYFNEKNQIMESLLCKAERGWDGIDFDYKKGYSELKFFKKRKEHKKRKK